MKKEQKQKIPFKILLYISLILCKKSDRIIVYMIFYLKKQRRLARKGLDEMSKYRRTRINDEVTRVMAEAIRTVKDPRVANAIITITKAEVSGDLKFAKIYFSVFGDENESIKEIKTGLYSAAGYLRSYIARELNLRLTPELSFEHDKGMEHGADIMRLLKSIETVKDESAEEVEEDE